MVLGLESSLNEDANALATASVAKKIQAVSAAVVSRPKNRHGRRLRSSSTMRAAVIGRFGNIAIILSLRAQRSNPVLCRS
jgi:hypothetical protein